MSLTRQLKIKPDNVVEILAIANGRIYSNMDSDVIAEVLVQRTFGTRYRNLW